MPALLVSKDQDIESALERKRDLFLKQHLNKSYQFEFCLSRDFFLIDRSGLRISATFLADLAFDGLLFCLEIVFAIAFLVPFAPAHLANHAVERLHAKQNFRGFLATRGHGN